MGNTVNTVDALKSFRTHLDVEQLAEDLSCTPAAAEKLWSKTRREMARKKFNKKAAREFAAELDEMFDVVQALLIRQVVAYNGGSDKLTGYASVGKLLAELAKTRYTIRQDLGLIAGGRPVYVPRPENKVMTAQPKHVPAPEPDAPRPTSPAPEPTLVELERELAALQKAIDRKRVTPAS